MKLWPFILFLYGSVFLYGQNGPVADSLLSALSKEKDDTSKVNTLNELSWELKNKGDYASALNYTQQAKILSEKNSFLRGKATAYDRTGLIYYNQGNYAGALEEHFTSLKIREALNDKAGIAATRHNIGNIYYAQNEFDKALEQYLLSLKIKKELGNTRGIANSLNNIGSIYVAKHDLEKALGSYSQALEISEHLNDKYSIANLLNNMGIIYLEKGEYAKAIGNHSKALSIREELGDKEGIATSYLNLGMANLKLAVAEKNQPAKKKILDEAGNYLGDALALSQKVDSKETTMECYKGLAELDSVTGNWNRAYYHYTRYISYRDSIVNEENTKKSMHAQMQYDFDKKEAISKAAQEKQLAENRKQKIIIWFSALGLLVAAVFAFFIFHSLKTVRKQKLLIEEKNKDILDSITYAQRIQQAILIPEEEIKKHFSDAFVLFKPKDIVSGDFYFFGESKYNKVLAAADCTGHGVPGGFMSMLGFEILQETLLLEEVKTTAEAFTALDKKITETLNRNDRSYRDGMDMVLCAFSKTDHMLRFSCANRPLVLIRNGEVKEFASDKYTIGGGIDNIEKKFRNQEIETRPGDLVYLFSDGYADQFGGADLPGGKPGGKKFMYKKLLALLASVSPKSSAEQKEIIEQTFLAWKGALGQVDDVMIIGIRV